MCIFGWDRWSCGHYRKTRIEYCATARTLPAQVREDNTHCHIPSRDYDFNHHIPTCCDDCISGYGNIRAVLPYITQVTPDRRGCGPDRRTHHWGERERQRIQFEVPGTRDDIEKFQTTYRDSARKSIYFLTQRVFQVQDEYRRIGYQYYAGLWMGFLQYQRLAPDLAAHISEALHGSNADREFLQPCEDVHRLLEVALSNVSLNNVYQAYNNCYLAFVRLNTMFARLRSLRQKVESIEDLGFGYHDAGLQQQRDEAL
ncbi:uncharacterized protein EI97DRAFT_440118 [Westerdykella ornata]|uniref:Uncharacterized protein n=1 Tax=Westerdykella ornata TaxID=318751 RepID=A0A6A6JTD5_WESOR|nr:uncharacterized protein EI97DRAFT_440118 [Westerdykella ornata]KAF2279832.1 hypothetical protein EI97DRAFT_440118 [Westerdykella ornata]